MRRFEAGCGERSPLQGRLVVASLMNGLSAFGQGVSQFAGSAGLELQKSQLAQQQTILADQLATTRETGLQASGGVIAAAAAQKDQDARAANLATSEAGANTRNLASIAGSAANTAATIAGQSANTTLTGTIAAAAAQKLQAFEMEKARLVASLPTPEEREVRAYTGGALPGSPEYRKGVADMAMVKLGMDPNTYSPSMSGAGGSGTATPSVAPSTSGSSSSSDGTGAVTPPVAPLPGTPGASPPAVGTQASGASSSLATPTSLPPVITAAVLGDSAAPVTPPKPGLGLSYKPIEPGLDKGAPAGGYNERVLLGQPEWLVSMVHGMNEGRIEPPTPRSLSDVKSLGTPEGRAATLLAAYNPAFDAGLYPARIKMRESIATGPIGDGIQAANTVIQHASEFVDKAADLGNGRIPFFNWVGNTALDYTGSARPDNLRMAVGTLAAESRKVYAGSGGGTQSELDAWEKNFPVSGSPAQQSGAMSTLVDLLKGKLTAVSNRINSGMQTNITALDLLNPTARASYDKLAASGGTSAPPPGPAIPSWAQPGDQYSPLLGLARRADGTTYGAPR
jgi:hypothetical protein